MPASYSYKKLFYQVYYINAIYLLYY